MRAKLLSTLMAIVTTFMFFYGLYSSSVKAAKASLADSRNATPTEISVMTEAANPTPQQTPQSTPVQLIGNVDVKFKSSTAYIEDNNYVLDLDYVILNNTNVDIVGVYFTFEIYDRDGVYIDSIDVTVDSDSVDDFYIKAGENMELICKLTQNYVLSADFPEQDTFSKIYLREQANIPFLFEAKVKQLWY